eukprot:m.334299 g.334299  ORF g.334299 m.334299 type:complete len:273 (+) comp16070_c0_seq3:897-1715(+)
MPSSQVVPAVRTVAVVLCTLFAVTSAQSPCKPSSWFQAARINDQYALRECLRKDSTIVDTRDELGCTALVVAASNRHSDTIRLLVKEGGADVQARCRSGNSAMTYVAKQGDLETFKFLHKNGGDIHLANKNDESAFTLTARHGHLDIVEYIHGLDTEIFHAWSGTELMWAAAHNSVVQIHAAMSRPETHLEQVDAHGNTALLWACRQGSVEMFHELISRGANVKVLPLTWPGRLKLTRDHTHHIAVLGLTDLLMKLIFFLFDVKSLMTILVI